MRCTILCLCLSLIVVSASTLDLSADDTWSGGGGNAAWSTDANWDDNGAPDPANGGTITFDNTAVGFEKGGVRGTLITIW